MPAKGNGHLWLYFIGVLLRNVSFPYRLIEGSRNFLSRFQGEAGRQWPDRKPSKNTTEVFHRRFSSTCILLTFGQDILVKEELET